MIKKINGKYFVDSIKELMLVDRKLEKPLPVEIQDSNDTTREPPCCICGSIERKDVIICSVAGDWKKRICSSCVEKHMPDLMPVLEKRIKERYLEMGYSEEELAKEG